MRRKRWINVLPADYLQLCQNGAEAKFMTELCLVLASFFPNINAVGIFFKHFIKPNMA